MRSYSSASTTNASPCPARAFVFRLMGVAPMMKLGSSSASIKIVAIMLVVVLLPCVPATAMPTRSCINAFNTSPRCHTFNPRFFASTNSGSSGLMALDGASTNVPTSIPSKCATSCPTNVSIPSAFNASNIALGLPSQPVTVTPRPCSTRAIALMPAPPMPMMWIFRSSRFIVISKELLVTGY